MDLSHLKIIDLSTVLAGPSVGTFFAELGAKVIKIEHPDYKDVTRTWKLPVENPDTNVSAYFSSINYGKDYFKLNLKLDEHRNVFLSMIGDCDILLSNFKKGDAEKFGITDEILQQMNPRLIIGKINGYGVDSNRVAYDLILQAETGFMSMNGTPESGPVKMPVALIDVLAAHHLKEGILLSLYNRTLTGKGKSISVSLYDAAVSSLVNQASNYLMAGKVAERIGSLHPNIAPYGEIFETKNKRLITFAIGSDKHFEKLCDYLDLDLHLQNDFSSNQNRIKNRKEIFDILQKEIIKLDSNDIIDYMIENNVPAGEIKSIDSVFESKNAQRLVRTENIEGVETKRVASKIFTWK